MFDVAYALLSPTKATGGTLPCNTTNQTTNSTNQPEAEFDRPSTERDNL
jgi:hypothetical protein